MNFRNRYFLLLLLFVPVFFWEKGNEVDERAAFESYLASHAYYHSNFYGVNVKAIPKRDRPNLGWQQNFLMTMDPSLGRPTPELMRATQIQLNANNRFLISTPGTATNPWEERGPNNVAGRTRAIAWDPNDGTGKKVWAGGVTGGLWYNNDIYEANSQWTKVSQLWDNQAVTSIAFDPTNTQIIYVGTGEGWGAGSSRGFGIWKSTDGGTNWDNLVASRDFYYINDLKVRDEGGNGVLYVGVKANHYEGDFHGLDFQGLQRSTDGGNTFTQVMPDIPSQAINWAIADIEIDAGNRLWVGTQENAYSSTNQGGGAILFSDNGTTWTLSTQRANGSRVEVATAPSNVNVLYALIEYDNKVEEVLKSTDRGNTWLPLDKPEDADPGIPNEDFTRGQAWYDLILGVSPTNSDVVIAGGIDLFKSTNGGTSWGQISHWYGGFGFPAVHADQHAIVFRGGGGADANDVLFGHDGGIDISLNINAANPSFETRNNHYNVTQFYSVAMHPGDGVNFYLGGTQDNGSQRFNQPGINSTTEVSGGDGAYSFIDQTDPTYQLTSYVYNEYFRSTNGGDSFDENNPILKDEGNGMFINPADYDDNLHILYSTRTATSLYRVSGINGTPSVFTLTVPDMGSLTSHIRVSPHTTTSTTLFVGTESGRVFKIANANTGSPVQTDITSNIPVGWVSSIDVGATENQLLLTLSNFGVVSVWETTNGGTSWTNKEGNLPNIPVRWGMYNPSNRIEVILATDLGIWRTGDLSVGAPAWAQVNNGLTNVRVDMLQYRASDNQVVAATHGRGLFTSSFQDADAAPVCADQAFDVDENSSNGTVIGTVVATDPNSLALTFSIVGSSNPNGTFAIEATGANAGRLTVANNTLLDFETNTVFELKVNVSNGTEIVQATITINVNDVNEAPVASNATFQFHDNEPNGYVVGTVEATDPDANTSLGFSILPGIGDDVFQINASTGQITILNNSLIDFSTTPQYVLTVEVSDGALTDEATITINVLKFNNPPVVDAVTFAVQENSTNGIVVGTVNASDLDSDDFTFSITAGNDLGVFAINATTGEITIANNTNLDFEQHEQFLLTVTVTETLTDPAKSGSATITINVDDVNEVPVAVNETFEIFNTIDNGESVGTVQATDPDANTTLVYTITAGNADGIFAINGSTGAITIANKDAIDIAVKDQYILTVNVSDGALSANATITIDIFSSNNTPVITANGPFPINEDLSAGGEVGQVVATDQEDDELTFDIVDGNTGGTFAIDQATGMITVANTALMDFATNPQFILKVRVSQQSPSLSSEANVTINLLKVPKPPVIVAGQVFEKEENQVNGTIIGQVEASDPDGDNIVFFVTGSTVNGLVDITTDGRLYVSDSAEFDYEKNQQVILDIMVQKVGLPQYSTTEQVIVNILDVNEKPFFTNAGPFSLPENSLNGTVVGTVAASDDDGDTFEYSIYEGNAAGTFEIDPITGVLSVLDSTLLDFENYVQFVISVVALETNKVPPLSDTTFVVINITNVNEPPTIADQTLPNVFDNVSNGYQVGRVAASDPDAGTTLNFSITGGNTNGVFAINATSGMVTVLNRTTLNANVTPQYLLTVQVTDGTFAPSAIVTINVVKVNNPPTMANQPFPVNENSPAGHVIGTIEVGNADGDPLEFEILSGNNGNAVAISNTGVITIADSSKIDHELNAQLVLQVRVRETNTNPALSATATITINIKDINEAPVILPQTYTVLEQVANGYFVAKIVATDPDKLDFPTFSITAGNTGGTFAINAISGQLTVANNTLLRFATNPTFALTVRVDDGEFQRSAVITINLIKINEPPVIVNQQFFVNENAPVGTIVDTVRATDGDGDALRFTLIAGNRGQTFTLAQNGVLRVSNNTLLNFEKDTTFWLTVVVDEPQINPPKSDTAIIKVFLRNVNEAPEIVNQEFSIQEKSANNAIVGKVVATDPEPADTLRYTITAGNTGGAFSINLNTGQIRVANTAQIIYATTPIFSLTVAVSDGRLSTNATVTIKLIEINLPPTIANRSILIAESIPLGTAFDTIPSSDPNNDPLVYSVTGGNISDAFSITPNGIVKVNNRTPISYALNPQFKLTITVTETNRTPALTASATYTINLNDVPAFFNQSFSVEENVAQGFVIGKLGAEDKVGAALKFTIVSGNPDNAIALALDGTITVSNASMFDYEKRQSITFVAQVSDSSLTRNAIITLFLIDMPEPPTMEDQEFSIEENPIPGTLLGRVLARDPDGKELNFRLLSGNIDGAFLLNASGTLTVANPAPIDFETNPVFNLRVAVNDEVDTVEANVKIVVLNINDAPYFKSQVIVIREDTKTGTIIGNLDAKDDDGDPITYKLLSGNIDSAFAVTATGDIVVNRGDALNYEVRNLYTLTIEVSDGELVSQNIIDIKLTNVIDNILITSVDDVEEEKVNVYPNPVQDRLYITLPSTTRVDRMIIADLSGKVLFNETSVEVWSGQLEINTSAYHPGIYLLIINDQSFKIIKR